MGSSAHARFRLVPTAAICASACMYAALTLGGGFVFARDTRAQAQGVPIPPATDAHADERGAHVAGEERASIPIDLVFERLYLGFLPATALHMIVVMVLVVVPTVWLVLRPMQRVCGGVPRS